MSDIVGPFVVRHPTSEGSLPIFLEDFDGNNSRNSPILREAAIIASKVDKKNPIDETRLYMVTDKKYVTAIMPAKRVVDSEDITKEYSVVTHAFIVKENGDIEKKSFKPVTLDGDPTKEQLEELGQRLQSKRDGDRSEIKRNPEFEELLAKGAQGTAPEYEGRPVVAGAATKSTTRQL